MLDQQWKINGNIDDNIKEVIKNTEIKCTEYNSQEQIFGGMSNLIQFVQCTNTKFIIKIYLDENNSNKEFELNVQTKLNLKSDITSKILCRFKNGHIESFLEGKSLDKVEIQWMRANLSEKIAKLIREFHDLNILEQEFTNHEEQISSFFDYYYNLIEKITKIIPNSNHTFPDINLEFLNEIVTFQLNKSLTYDSKILLIHSDLTPGNFIWNEYENKLSLIDFEQCRIGPIYQEFANQFLELCGLDCNWKIFPDFNERCQFYYQYGYKEEEFETIDQGVMFQTKVSHFWGIWAVYNQLLTGSDDQKTQGDQRLKELQKIYEKDKII